MCEPTAELVGVPLGVICAGCIGVTDSHTLYVRFAQEVKHDTQTLAPTPMKAILILSLGANIPWAAQHPARNDGKTNCRSGSLPKNLRRETAFSEKL